ncbi:RNA polymerase sigma factor [Paenibacillus sp. CAU 1782]
MNDGGPEHYRPFVKAYGTYIYRTVYAVLQSPHDAEDVTQEVLLQIYRSLPSYRMDGWKAWITRIAVNKAIDYKRSRARKPEHLVESQTLLEQQVAGAGAAEGMLDASPSPAAEDIALRHEERQVLLEHVNALPPKYREVVSAFYLDNKSYEQIATETGLERKSVESRLYRARDWMKKHWRKEDFE